MSMVVEEEDQEGAWARLVKMIRFRSSSIESKTMLKRSARRACVF